MSNEWDRLLIYRQTLHRKDGSESTAAKPKPIMEILKSPGVAIVLYIYSHTMLIALGYTAGRFTCRSLLSLSYADRILNSSPAGILLYEPGPRRFWFYSLHDLGLHRSRWSVAVHLDIDHLSSHPPSVGLRESHTSMHHGMATCFRFLLHLQPLSPSRLDHCFLGCGTHFYGDFQRHLDGVQYVITVLTRRIAIC